MKRTSVSAALLLVGAMTFATSCSTVTAHGGSLDEILSSKTLVIGTNAEYPPFEYVSSSTNEPVGFDIDFCGLIASEIESEYGIALNLVVKNMEFDSLLGSMTTNQIDLIAAAFSINAERAKSVLFSDVYYQAQTVLVVKSGVTIGNVDDLASLTIGAQLGTIQADKAADYSGSVVTVAALDSLITMLKTGNIGALMVEDAVGENIVGKNSGLALIDSLDFNDDGGYGIATNLGESDLIGLVNKVIAVNKASGALETMYEDAVATAASN
ncbi:MAG: transporter substrate-binding domain-containing protein [Bacilli bacterium]|nr:transporter substrate-binding domain-containing protein [Bacilli bacterium]